MSARSIVVIPTYNEAENLEAFAREALAALPDADLLIVDDDSPDGTGVLADRLAVRSPRVDVLHRPAKSGLASAYVDGFQRSLAAGYERLYQMDADGSHDPHSLVELDHALSAPTLRADLAIGSRYVSGGETENWPLRRRLISRGGSYYARAMLRLSVRDVTSGFKGWNADLLHEVLARPVNANGYVFQIEMTYRAIRAGARVVEVPIHFADRALGTSKFGPGIVAEAMRHVAVMGGRDILRQAS